MKMPALIVLVTDNLRLNRELEQKGVHLGHCRLVVARRRRGENGDELLPYMPEHVKIAPGDRTVQAIPERAGACLNGAERIRLIRSLDSGVGKTNR